MPMRVSIVVVFENSAISARAPSTATTSHTNVHQSNRSRSRAPAASAASTRRAEASSLTPAMMPARRSPVLLVASLLMIGLSVLGGFVLRQDPAAPPWQGIDDAWHDLVRDPFPTEHSILDTIAIALNNFDALPGYLLFAALLVSMLLVRCWATAGYLVVVAAVGIGAPQLLKV